MLKVQTRNEDGELLYFNSLSAALNHAGKDLSVWKISFTLPNSLLETTESVSLVRQDGEWMLEMILA
jgi:hypothetical protein